MDEFISPRIYLFLVKLALLIYFIYRARLPSPACSSSAEKRYLSEISLETLDWLYISSYLIISENIVLFLLFYSPSMAELFLSSIFASCPSFTWADVVGYEDTWRIHYKSLRQRLSRREETPQCRRPHFSEVYESERKNHGRLASARGSRFHWLISRKIFSRCH